jgi:hypothetical protein
MAARRPALRRIEQRPPLAPELVGLIEALADADEERDYRAASRPGEDGRDRRAPNNGTSRERRRHA